MHELILGGARSGKSACAEGRARQWLAGGGEATLIATALAADAEMMERIARHRAERAQRAPGLQTHEEPVDLGGALRRLGRPGQLLVVDCLTLWLSQALLPPPGHAPLELPRLQAELLDDDVTPTAKLFAEAAAVVDKNGYRRVFLTTGRSGTQAFAGSPAWFLIRAVTPPEPDTLPERNEVLLSRGPYTYDGERALLREHRIDALVTKNSGGSMTRAKIDAATDMGIDIVMIARPSAPDVPSVGTVDDAVAWVRSR